ncbi:MAG: PIN domain-containing protein [Patescibacteria group bacterium]
MKTIVLDTNILIDYIHGYAPWLNLLLKSDSRVIISTIVVAEYLQAPSLDKKTEVRSAERTFALFEKQDLTQEIAEILGRMLRRKKYPPGADLVDLIIASTALYLDAQLATRNKLHFKGIPGLRFFDPKELEN